MTLTGVPGWANQFGTKKDYQSVSCEIMKIYELSNINKKIHSIVQTYYYF